MRRAQRNTRVAVDIAVASLCAAAAVFVLADVQVPARAAVVLAALVLGPGWAATCWLDLEDPAFAATVALATGVALLFLYGLWFVAIGWWHPLGSAGVLLAAAGAASAVAAARETRRKHVR